LLSTAALLNPFGYGSLAPQLIIHKLLRFATPAVLLPGGAARLAGSLLEAGTDCGRINCDLLRWRGGGSRQNAFVKVSEVLDYCLMVNDYCLMVNDALLLAWGNLLRGGDMTVWSLSASKAAYDFALAARASRGSLGGTSAATRTEQFAGK
jgi:hypothetical protein